MQQIIKRIKELTDQPGHPDRAVRLQRIREAVEAEIIRLIHKEDIKKRCKVNNDEVIRPRGL